MTDPRKPIEDDRIAVVRSEERLLVGTERVPIERVRVVKRLVTETRMVEVTLRREELVVERGPVGDGGAAAVASDSGEGLVWTLSEEVPVITTELRPVEVVRVIVDRVTSEQAVAAELRRERIEVETGDGTRVGTERPV